MSDLIPISDAQAEAIKEALKSLNGFGSFLRDTLGTVPSDIVGRLGGDYLKIRRAENLAKMFKKAQRRLEDAKIVTEPPSLSLLLPIIEAASDEDRDELQDIWAGLLASAANPLRKNAFRIKFVEIAKKMDPLDVCMLSEVAESGGTVGPIPLEAVKTKFRANPDEIQISLVNLTDLGLLGQPSASRIIYPLGREFLRAVRS